MAVDGDRKKRGPYLLVIPYIVAGLTHELSWQCSAIDDPEGGTPPIDITLRTRNGVGRTLADAAAAFWSLAYLFIPSDASVGQYYLYRTEAGTDKRYFISSGPLSEEPDGGVHGPARQMTETFRTANSGIVRLVILEVNNTADTLVPLNAVEDSPDPATALAYFFVAPESPVLGTDASWIVAPMSIGFTQNEAVYNSRFRK
jgi:hypothetical protein